MTLRTVHMDFLYGGAFRTELPEAYERLILDCLLGDATLFTRADEVDEQWALVDSIVAALEARPSRLPELRRRHLGAGRGRRAARAGRARSGADAEDTSVAEIERRLDAAARARDEPSQRTSVLTHMAWVPPEWSRAAGRVLEGLGPRVPSRTILLHPDPRRRATTRLDARSSTSASRAAGTTICAEVVRIWLRGEHGEGAGERRRRRSRSPTCRRSCAGAGEPPFGRPELEQLVERHRPADRRLERVGRPARRAPTARLAEVFDRIVGLRPRLGADAAVARGRSPTSGRGSRRRRSLHVAARGPRRSCSRGWLRSRLQTRRRARAARRRASSRASRSTASRSASAAGTCARRSDLLSDELEVFARDRDLRGGRPSGVTDAAGGGV